MSETNAVELCLTDPLQYTLPLAYTVRLYPMGFPADIASNAPEVLEAARESWAVYPPRFDTPPVRVHVLVSEGIAAPPPSPALRGQRHLLLWVSDQENFAVCDWRQRFAFSFVTRANVADRVFFRWHFLDALIYMLLELNYYTSVHGACVAWEGSGVLLYGPSGMGKSTLTYACARRGWTYTSDDGSSLMWGRGRTALGEPHHFRFREDASQLFPELRGRTVGRQLDRKPTIEVLTDELPIRTAPECRIDRIVFVNRDAGTGASLRSVPQQDARERILRDQCAFDPDLDERRMAAVESICDMPAFELHYSHFEEAVDLLETLVRGGESA